MSELIAAAKRRQAADAPVARALLPTPSCRVILALALPVLAQQGLVFLVLQSDRFLAGHLRVTTIELQAAQTTAQYVAWFISCYTILVTVGSTALVARFTGAGDRALAVRVTHQSLLLAVFFGLSATLVASLGGLRLLVDVLQLTGLAAQYALDYLHPLFLLVVFQMLELAGISCLIGAGDTRTGLYVMIGVAIVNLPLAWGLCFGLGPASRSWVFRALPWEPP